MRIKLFSFLLLTQRRALFPAFVAGVGLLWFTPMRPSIETQVLVINGGAGGTAAGIQSARMGVSTLVVEPTAWLGGMLTAAGVSATDGNHRMPAGIWGEFREQIRDYYGGPEAVATGWVSNTHFEPHAGAAIFRQMAEREPPPDRLVPFPAPLPQSYG
ncbi:MAG: FAD-dependent oxidoreductase [Haliscomenobacter sp.]|nr:FAD-dependent oxidoreductase [Haliscomenobacter sp.]